MKYTYNIVLAAIFTFFGATAQEAPAGTLDATTKKTFTIEADGTTTKYHVKIFENRTYPMAWEKADKGKVNQDRKTTEAKVTKMIAVDTNSDNDYEQYFVLKYRKSIADTFKLVPTSKGFAVMVDGTIKQHFDREGIYFINNPDQDFFSVIEFRSIG